MIQCRMHISESELILEPYNDRNLLFFYVKKKKKMVLASLLFTVRIVTSKGTGTSIL